MTEIQHPGKSPDQVTIRPLVSSDSVEELTRLLNLAYSELKMSGLNYSAATQSPVETRRRIQDRECFIAVCGDVIIGTVLYVNQSRPGSLLWYDHPGVAVFYQVAVHPDWRSRGVGKMLLDYIEKRASREGAKEIAADTAAQATQLLEMYKKRGYRIVDYTYWPNVNYCSVVFSKSLCGESGVSISFARRLPARWRARLRQLKWRLSKQGKSVFSDEENTIG